MIRSPDGADIPSPGGDDENLRDYHLRRAREAAERLDAAAARSQEEADALPPISAVSGELVESLIAAVSDVVGGGKVDYAEAHLELARRIQKLEVIERVWGRPYAILARLRTLAEERGIDDAMRETFDAAVLAIFLALDDEEEEDDG